MSEDFFVQLNCPSCTHPIDLKSQGQQIECPACRSQLLLDGHVCPNCGEYHRDESGFCRACGTAMTRTCEKCRTPNWSGAEYCQQCGAALDIFQLLHLHNKQTTMNRLDDQMRDAQYFKEKERADSEKRMALLMEQEEVRQQQVRAHQAAQKKQDQQLLLTAAFVLTLFVVIVAAFAVL